MRPGLREHRERGRRVFFNACPEVDAGLHEDIPGRSFSRVAMTCFLALDHRIEGSGRTVIEDLLARRGPKLPSAVRRALENLAATPLELYDVRGARPDAGELDLGRIAGGDELVVKDEYLSDADLERGTLFAARLVPNESGALRIGADLYEFPRADREALLRSLEELGDREPDARFFHDRWIAAPGLRGRASRYPDLTAELGDYLDEGDLSIRVPREARALGLYLGRIAAGASVAVDEGEWVDTYVSCRRRPARRRCDGRILACVEPDRSIAWSCPGCGDAGTIRGWEGTAFDLSERANVLEEPPTVEAGYRVLRLPAKDYRRFLNLVHLTGPALRFVVSARPLVGGERRLIGRPEELVALARCIAFHFARAEEISDTAADVLEDLHGALALYGGERPDLSQAAQCAEVLLFDRARRRSPRSAAEGAQGTHRLHVQLKHIEPPVWRRIELPSAFTLEDLYEALILAFGWSDTHLHVFEHEGRFYGRPHPDDFKPVNDERAVRLADLLPAAGARLVLEYDFGDSWRHEIVVEEIFPEPSDRPCLVAGGRATPPEDCGGPPGYERLLTILADPYHEEHAEMIEWSDDFDPEEFDLAKFDERVGRMGGPPATAAPRGASFLERRPSR